VKAEQNPEYLKAIAEAVTEFRDAVTELLELYVPFGQFVGRGIAPPVVPREGADESEIERRKAKVTRAAGRAAAAPSLTHYYIGVAGVGEVDPVAAWMTITQPNPLLEPDDVLGACNAILGRLESLLLKAEAEAPPTIGAAAMHPLVWGAARRLWTDRHFQEAVRRACEALVAQLKAVTGRNNVPDTALWQETFSAKPAKPGEPRLRWPGDPSDQTVKSMNEGLRSYAPGVQMLIRNPATHGDHELTEQEALERLATLSLLARWLDECKLDRA
jgi:hypothetical protein